MENIADALKMAASVLIFVLALSICINSFSQVRQASQVILDYNDRTYDDTYVKYKINTTERIVGAETIVPSIYRAFIENYKIVFNDEEIDYLYERNNEKYKSIDLEELSSLGVGPTQREPFINMILYRKYRPGTE